MTFSPASRGRSSSVEVMEMKISGDSLPAGKIRAYCSTKGLWRTPYRLIACLKERISIPGTLYGAAPFAIQAGILGFSIRERGLAMRKIHDVRDSGRFLRLFCGVSGNGLAQGTDPASAFRRQGKSPLIPGARTRSIMPPIVARRGGRKTSRHSRIIAARSNIMSSIISSSSGRIRKSRA